MSLARWRQRLNPLHPILLKKEREHFEGRRYRKIIALTEQVRHDLNRFYGVPPEDVVVIPNGYSPVDFNPAVRRERRAEMRAKLGLAPDETALLFVAHELERKGYPSILAAMRILGSAKLRLLVVGRNDPGVVTAMATRFGVERQVMACPPTSDVAGYHAASDAFVLPTQYEAFCLAILEALGSGLPVVTTRVPGAQDAIIDGENGCLIADPRDSEELAETLRCLLDEGVREQFSRKAAASVTSYAWDSVLSRYEEVLQSARN
jgi:UDP-glucose:(heptosyl)LPS alpha-1,3-glucosyltransferase